MKILSWVDFLMVPLWLIIIYTGANILKNIRYRNDPTAGLFIPALTVKILGGILLSIPYQFYYSGGDTITYYTTARSVVLVFLDNIEHGWLIFSADFSNLDFRANFIINEYVNKGLSFPYWNDPYAFNTSRFFIIANALTFNSYYASSMVVSAISFIGIWGMFRVFYRQYPEIKYRLAIGIFFVPSVFFWGSGILKDSITIGLLGMITYACYRIITNYKLAFLYVMVLIFCGYMIYIIKPYIVLGFIPFVAVWVGINIRRRVVNPLLRFSFGPLLLVLAFGFGYLLVSQLGQGRYSVDNVLTTAVIVKQDLTSGYYYSDTRGSSYDIGQFDDSFGSQFRLFPTAIITTFFRPFLWEVRNPLMLLASLESTVLLAFTMLLLFRGGLINFIIVIYKRPFVLFSFGFSLAFAFMVGLTSGNFGNLVRYKIPCIPFFIGSLIIIDHLITQNRNRLFIKKALEKQSQPSKA